MNDPLLVIVSLTDLGGELGKYLIMKIRAFLAMTFWAVKTFIELRGGDNGYFFVKLDFEIAVDQQTRTSDRTFEGVPDPNRQTVPAGQPRPYLVQIRPNLAKYPEHAQNPYFMCSTCS